MKTYIKCVALELGHEAEYQQKGGGIWGSEMVRGKVRSCKNKYCRYCP